jgi:hypothetical protein
VRPLVVLRHFAVELKPMRITHASDGCSRPGVLRYPSGGRNSSQVTAATEQVSIDAWWSASGGDLLAVLCDGF